jgi:hypothetical protein
MPLNVFFWVLLIIVGVLGFWSWYAPPNPYPVRQGIWLFALLLLIAILGWHDFGAVVRNN